MCGVGESNGDCLQLEVAGQRTASWGSRRVNRYTWLSGSWWNCISAFR